MNPKKYKTVDECNDRLTWLEAIIGKQKSIPPTLSGGEYNPNYKPERLPLYEREQRAIYKRREALKTDELPLSDE